MSVKSKWKQILLAKQPKYEKCIWCEEKVNVFGFDYVCDGRGDILHYDCANERLGIIKDENRKKRTDP